MDRELFETAGAVREHAHAPYSKFRVGAALRTEDGAVYAGTNVENGSYPEGWCAETSAIAHMVAAAPPGPGRRIAAVAVVAERIDGRLTTPCGGCRQRLAEFASPDTPVHVSDPRGETRTFTMRELLPAAFSRGTGMNGAGADAAAIIRASADLPFEAGIVLGSGLSGLADHVAEPIRIPYAELPGFPLSRVSSHANELVAGWLEGVAVVVFSGRQHYFEEGNPAAMREPIATLAALGADTLLLTNAAGSLRTEVGPGEVMLITDHIAFGGTNPLIGEPTDARFVGMTSAYDPDLRASLLGAAEREGVACSTGVYMWFSGPSFETPAEIRMARLMGAHAVGMSTVPEVILGRFFGLRCGAMSAIVNFAAGMTGAELSHEETKALAPIGAAKLERIIRRYMRDRAWSG